MADSPSTPEIVIMAAGGVALLGSFLPFVDVGGEFGVTISAWGDGLLPIATYVAIFGVLQALAVALPRFAGMDVPRNVAGFTLLQVHLALGFFSALIMIGYLIVNDAKGIGFWLMFLAAAGLLAGAVLLQREGSRPGTGPAPRSPF
ncbi:MAG: hypothetical protein WKF93_00280 [Acidimicrobiales bacterium]